MLTLYLVPRHRMPKACLWKQSSSVHKDRMWSSSVSDVLLFSTAARLHWRYPSSVFTDGHEVWWSQTSDSTTDVRRPFDVSHILVSIHCITSTCSHFAHYLGMWQTLISAAWILLFIVEFKEHVWFITVSSTAELTNISHK